MNFANSEAVQPCKAIDGMIPLSESFRPAIVHIQLLMQRQYLVSDYCKWISEGMRYLLLAR